jgi:hypothetical protein
MHLAEVFSVMSDNGQSVVASSNGNENIEISNNQSFTGEGMADFGIVMNPITKRQYGEGLFNFLWFL